MISVLHHLPDPTIEDEDGISKSSGLRHRNVPRPIPTDEFDNDGQGWAGANSTTPSPTSDQNGSVKKLLTNDSSHQPIHSSQPSGSSIMSIQHDQALPQHTTTNPNESDADWKSKLEALIISFLLSGIYTLLAYIFPILAHVPIFGNTLSRQWLWNFTPSLSYAGQGIIMGLPTCIWMLVGAIVGWGVLSPIAKYAEWASGPVDDWKYGSRGWILWISLAVMIADSLVSLSIISYKELSYRLHAIRNTAILKRLSEFDYTSCTCLHLYIALFLSSKCY